MYVCHHDPFTPFSNLRISLLSLSRECVCVCISLSSWDSSLFCRLCLYTSFLRSLSLRRLSSFLLFILSLSVSFFSRCSHFFSRFRFSSVSLLDERRDPAVEAATCRLEYQTQEVEILYRRDFSSIDHPRGGEGVLVFPDGTEVSGVLTKDASLLTPAESDADTLLLIEGILWLKGYPRVHAKMVRHDSSPHHHKEEKKKKKK